MNSRSVKKHNPETGKNTDWPELAGDAERSFVKTHMPYWEGNLAANKADVVIVLVRNPFDCMMSRLSHNRLHGVEISKAPQLRNFFSNFISSANAKQYEIRPDRLDGGWINHYESWRDAESFSANLALIRFEDLLKDCPGELGKVNRALDLGWNKLDIERGSLFGSKKWMSALESHEVANEIPGMFYSPARARAFEGHGGRFVGGKRKDSDFETFVNNHLDDFINTFAPPCERLGYDLASIIESKRTS